MDQLLAIICTVLANVLLAVNALDVLELGSSLTPASDPLLSASSNFGLAFRKPDLSSATSSNLFLAVYFVVDSSYPVWVANRNTPVSASASLTLSHSGDLLLLLDASAPNSSLIWKSNTADRGVVRAQLLDSGNLVLLNSRSDYVWQSFHYPTDTLLPDQDFTISSTALTSNKKRGDFHAGRYSLNFTSLVEAFDHVYHTLGNVSSVRFDNLGNITFYNMGSDLAAASTSIVANDYGVSSDMRRMTLDVDSNLRLYTWDVNAAQWNSVWMLYLDICTQVWSGVCGSYGVCTYDPIKPVCICPQGFSAVDATDLSSGCAAPHLLAPDQNCNAHDFTFLEIDNVNFPDNDYHRLSPLSIEDCKKACLNSCECLAVVYTQSVGICWLKQKVENGYVEMSQTSRVLLKVLSSNPLVISSPVVATATKWNPDQYLWQPLVTYIKTNKYLGTIIALAVVIAIQGLCFAGTVAGLITRSRRQIKFSQLGEELEACPHAYSYEELRVATDNFSHKLGEGGFGTVYKGQLQSGKCVAVKQLEGMFLQQEKQFKAEIMTIGRIHHINLLRLVGFCSEGTHRVLVYEYMEKGSLDQILLQESSGKAGRQIEVLDWSTRFSICLSVARGIHYLHEECLNCILHCDIKPQNILLDRSYCAKVADFGLAYMQSRDQTVEMTTIRGTRGYLAPEWVSNLPITAKADVYSYGMLIMEIISGRSNYLYSQSASVEVGEKWCFPMWAYGKRIEEVVDARLQESSIDWKQVDMVLKVAFSCIQVDMNSRPTMGQVLQMLEGVLPVPSNVPPPSLISTHKLGVSTITSPSPQTFSVTRDT